MKGRFTQHILNDPELATIERLRTWQQERIEELLEDDDVYQSITEALAVLTQRQEQMTEMCER